MAAFLPPRRTYYRRARGLLRALFRPFFTRLLPGVFPRLFARRPLHLPGLHESTTWHGVRWTCTHPPERADACSLAALNYACAVALFLEAPDAPRRPVGRPTCTLAHVAAAVRLVDHDALLNALEAEAAPARLVAPLLLARREGRHALVAALVPDAHALVAQWHRAAATQASADADARVLAYFRALPPGASTAGPETPVQPGSRGENTPENKC